MLNSYCDPLVTSWSFPVRLSSQLEVTLTRLRICHTRTSDVKGYLPITSVLPNPYTFSVYHIFIGFHAQLPLRTRYFPALNSIPQMNRLSYVLAESPHFHCSIRPNFSFLSRPTLFLLVSSTFTGSSPP